MIRRGLTFIELLVAVALSGLIIVAASAMIFSMAQTWSSMETHPQLEHHADGVSGFMDYLFMTTQNVSGDPIHPAGWSKAPDEERESFHFVTDREHPFFVTDIRPQPAIQSWLNFDMENEQLWLIWRPDPRANRNQKKVRRALLSPWVQDVRLGFLDEEANTWEYESMGDSRSEHEGERPGSLQIIFAKDERTFVRHITIDSSDRNVLVY
ncbi:prepilin-type N-terminal cleavage/methylation domain-containing protein [Rubellicoccus peritrichatus]|uniref:Prepilin-type N-terminal cleavage/methylation domain-containing protein n=1 Tax=Rubellicoccus peritrichatus TaxID=3080537 RepID=A0AAQ3L9N4_9BACT|nr:prepilin-type N-terminal cleavage/methylation domain-containing protein [Puniceicoccus sp. CR14]WOO41930.1 prepilin-type N-terminal cleavage/methylation domain-containing protein [Puniceicoccus sp. CR14]